MAVPFTPQTVTITKKIKFSASHFYYLPQWSEAENQQVFKACSNRHGHGHNYVVEVAVKGPIAGDTGMVVNLKDLKIILNDQVVDHLDHKNLNHQIPHFADRVPTLENIVLYLWDRLEAPVKALGIELEWLKVEENDTLYVEYYGHPDGEQAA